MATIEGTSGADSLHGTGGQDTLNGDAGNDDLQGRGGQDVMNGQGGSDTMSGGNGNDIMNGGGGHDDLDGGRGDDELDGGNGRDRLYGGEGTDSLTGGRGDDTFVFDGDLAGLSLDTVQDFDVARQLRKMTFDDEIELLNVAGETVAYQQSGDDVELWIDGSLMALFHGSQGALDAADLLAATSVVGGDAASIGVI